MASLSSGVAMTLAGNHQLPTTRSKTISRKRTTQSSVDWVAVSTSFSNLFKPTLSVIKGTDVQKLLYGAMNALPNVLLKKCPTGHDVLSGLLV
jgi:hypothetical protein